jgi:NAD+ synthase (glutamine-hydrolysing)
MGIDKFGFIRVAAVAPQLKVADVDYNTEQITSLLPMFVKQGIQIAVFPELCTTGYTCGDLFYQPQLILKSYEALIKIKDAAKDIIVIVGTPLIDEDKLYNCAAVIGNNKILGIVPKTYLPNRNEFYEERWFKSGGAISKEHSGIPFGADLLFNTQLGSFAIELCEDLWAPIPPSSYAAMAGAKLTFNLSASNALIGKTEYRRELVRQQSARTISGYVYASANCSESTTDLVYSGHLMICENGTRLAEKDNLCFETKYITADIDFERLSIERLKNSSFSKSATEPYQIITTDLTLNDVTKSCLEPKSLHREYSQTPFVPSDTTQVKERCEEILSIQSIGLAKRLKHTGIKKVVLGLSGGLDSTLALLVCIKTFRYLDLPYDGIIAISMPGLGTSTRTKNQSKELAKCLGVTFKEISIVKAVEQHFKDIKHSEKDHDTTYQNSQARERTQILMDLANKYGALVVGTGDLSEIAIGWNSYCGDHMSMYCVNCSIPKTLVKYLIRYYGATGDTLRVLKEILDTPISPELLPLKRGKINQITEDSTGPYILHDFFLYYFMRACFPPDKIFYIARKAFDGKYNEVEIRNTLKTFFRMFFQNQFKKSCMPDGPKVGSVALSPRGDWRMPSDAEAKIWLNNI